MSNINSVVISGNLIRDPELINGANDSKVLKMCVAVNDRKRNHETGEWENVPNFIDCVFFGARAEGLSKTLTKGSRVTVKGRLSYRSWQDSKTGERRSKLDVVGEDIEFMSRANRDNSAAAVNDVASRSAYVLDESGDIVF